MAEDNLSFLRQSLLDAPIIWKEGYPYFVHPITDGVPRLPAEVLTEIIDEVQTRADWSNIDLLLGIEAMGLPLTAPLSMATNLPFAVIRKRPYGMEGEIQIEQQTGYSKASLYINDVNPSEKIAIFDDVISTGGTLFAIIDGLLKADVVVSEVLTVVEKGSGMKMLQEKYPQIRFQSLLQVEMIDGRVHILN
jgi:adenine phosphoribosyltransferase